MLLTLTPLCFMFDIFKWHRGVHKHKSENKSVYALSIKSHTKTLHRLDLLNETSLVPFISNNRIWMYIADFVTEDNKQQVVLCLNLPQSTKQYGVLTTTLM